MSSILDKISKILAQAERTDNEHEADAFAAQAQRLAARYSIDLAVARQHTAKAEKRETPEQRIIDIGERRAMGNAKLVNLFHQIALVNDVRINVAHNSTYVIAFGFPSDIDVTEALYAHLATEMVTGASAYLRSDAHKRDSVWDPASESFKPMPGKTARLNFYDSFTTRISQRLWEARSEAVSAADEEAAVVDEASESAETGGTPGAALVLADKKAEVDDFYAQQSNARGTWRGGRRRSAAPSSASARAAGRRAGDAAQLRQRRGLVGGQRQLTA